jgi:hypothetical protein
MGASEINGLAGFIQRSFYENAAVTNLLFLPSCSWWCKSASLVVQICAGPQISRWGGMMFVMASSRISCLGPHMGEVVQFIPKRISNAFASFERLARHTSESSRRMVPASLQSRNRFHDE